jgi:hypothetical protein
MRRSATSVGGKRMSEKMDAPMHHDCPARIVPTPSKPDARAILFRILLTMLAIADRNDLGSLKQLKTDNSQKGM